MGGGDGAGGARALGRREGLLGLLRACGVHLPVAPGQVGGSPLAGPRRGRPSGLGSPRRPGPRRLREGEGGHLGRGSHAAGEAAPAFPTVLLPGHGRAERGLRAASGAWLPVAESRAALEGGDRGAADPGAVPGRPAWGNAELGAGSGPGDLRPSRAAGGGFPGQAECGETQRRSDGQEHTSQTNVAPSPGSVQQELGRASPEGGTLSQSRKEGASPGDQPRLEGKWKATPFDIGQGSLPRDEGKGSLQEETWPCNQLPHCRCGQAIATCACRRAHEGRLAGGQLCPCSACQSPAAGGPRLAAHTGLPPGPELHRCLECARYFCSSAKLREHERIHTGEKPYRCGLCHKRFTFTTNLVAHQRIHTGEKPYQCLKCGKHFRQKGTLKTHENTHLVEKPFKCATCEKSFRQKGALTQHEKIHLAESAYAYAKGGAFLPAGKAHRA